MKVRIPSVLRSYTNGVKEVDAHGHSVLEVLDNLESRFPGIRFRFISEQGKIRNHMRIFLNSVEIENLNQEVNSGDDLFISQALSGGSTEGIDKTPSLNDSM